LDSVTVQVGLPDYMLQDNYVNQFYSQLPIQKLDFFLNVNHAISFATDYSQIKLKAKKEQYGWVGWTWKNENNNSHLKYMILSGVTGGWTI